MASQDDEEAVRGFLRLTLNGVDYRLPALLYGPGLDWVEMLDRKLDEVATASLSEQGVHGLAKLSVEVAVDLIAAYDVTGALGGPDQIRARSRLSDLRPALEVLRRESIPFGDELNLGQQIANSILRASLARSAEQNSTNGRSSIGVSPRASSSTRSRQRNSRSSGRQVRSA